MTAVGAGLINSYRRVSIDLLKIQAATAYVKGVQTVRRWWIGAIMMALLLLLLAAGFVMVHVGFFLWVPWMPATKAIVLLLLGLLYMGGGACGHPQAVLGESLDERLAGG